MSGQNPWVCERDNLQNSDEFAFARWPLPLRTHRRRGWTVQLAADLVLWCGYYRQYLRGNVRRQRHANRGWLVLLRQRHVGADVQQSVPAMGL